MKKKKRAKHYYTIGDCVVQGLVRRCVLRYCGTDQEVAERMYKEIKNYPPRECIGNVRLIAQ